MKNHPTYLWWILIFWISITNLSAQLLVDNTTYTPQQLVEQFLIGGGLEVSNVTLGASTINRQLGYFTNSNSNLGISEGIILSTGYADDASTPINNTPFFTSFSTDCVNEGLCLGGDADLSNIVGENTFDAAVLEFDFIPTGDSIRFRYVFASEEYNDYTCSEFNDLFAFLLTGPGHTNTNIAQIPNTTIPVAINSINNGAVGVNGVLTNCQPPNGSLSNTNLYVDNVGGNHVEFNGMTVVLEAVAAVTPCSTYHIKLAVADAVDHFIDSGVFLEANSFTTNSFEVLVDMPKDSTIVEGCNEAIVTFQLFQPLEQDLTIPYTLKGTAINGVDYNFLPQSATILQGDTNVSFNIIPIDDMVEDSFETIELQVPISPCSTATFLIFVREEEPLDTPTVECVYANAVEIGIGWDTVPNAIGYEVSIDGGLTWQNANGQNLHILSGLESDIDVQFLVRALGEYVICNSNPSDTIICSTISCDLGGTIVNLEHIDCFGNQNGSIVYTGQNGTTPYKYILDDIDLASVNQFQNLGAGTYQITVIDSNQCEYVDSFEIIEPDPLLINASSDVTIEFGESTQLSSNIVSNHTNVSYQWFPADFLSCINCPTPISTPTQSLNYTLVVTDENGCEASDNVTIQVLRPRSFFTASAFTPNNDGINDIFYIQGGDDLIEVVSFEIFDKWGELIFEKSNTPPNDSSFGWDGTLNSKPMNPNLFAWIVSVKYNDDVIVAYSGQIYLIR